MFGGSKKEKNIKKELIFSNVYAFFAYRFERREKLFENEEKEIK